MYNVSVIFPNPNADFEMAVAASSKKAAHAIAYRRLNDRFPGTLGVIGNIRRS